jgi:hypothetical protein
MEIRWEDGYEIRVRTDGETVTVSANREGLRSLALQLADLADEQPGTHIHLDRYNSLEDGSAELILERTE